MVDSPARQRVSSSVVNRLLRTLLLALFLGPQVGAVFVPSEAYCQEERDDCAPDEGCDVDCVACACCPCRAMSCAPAASLDHFDPPVESSTLVAAIVDLPRLSSDILHVPKSA